MRGRAQAFCVQLHLGGGDQVNEAPHPIQVVVAYDFSPSAEEALIRAIDIAARAPQHVLHVVCALDPSNYGRHVTTETADTIQRQARERVAAGFAGRITAADVQFFIHARIGHAADQVLDVARDVGADLVFVGSHGKTGVERLLLGSVSERIVREAKCPVMVVRHKEYAHVDLLKVLANPHERHTYHPPHRYSYVDRRVVTRPPDFPLY
jgi:nucleotide-binding universal stress UspA family protein